jgi:GxxExxY protein
MTLLYPEESYKIMGACFEVYKELGAGFTEGVYEEALELELLARELPHQPHPELHVRYKGQQLTKTFVPDFICYEAIILELKAASDLADEHRAQLHHYLKATGLRLGLLVNFGHSPRLQSERIAK